MFAGCQISLFDDLSLESLNSPNPYIQEAIERNPDNFHAWYLLGKDNLQNGLANEALVAFGKSKELKPAFEEARLGIAYAQLKLERWARAEGEFRELLALNPDSSEGHEGLSLALLKLEKDDEAKISAQRALELDPALPRAHAVLGRIAYGQMDYKTAELHWSEALAQGFTPQDLEPMYQDLRRMLDKYSE